MLEVTAIVIIAFLITLLGIPLKKEKGCFLFATVLLMLFFGLRTDYGNDIPAYMEGFDKIGKLDFERLLDSEARWEPGWMLLNYIFQPLGWQTFIFFLTIIQFGTVYWLIQKYAPTKAYWLIFFFYLFSSTMMLTQLSMLRQSLAMSICAWSVPFVLNKKFVASLLLLLLAAQVHSSAYVMLLLLLFPLAAKLRPATLIIIFSIVLGVLLIAKSIVGDILQYFLQLEQFVKYEVYSNEELAGGSGLGVMLQYITGCVMLYMTPNKDIRDKFFVISRCFAVALVPFVYMIMLIGRISMYFSFLGILSYYTLLRKEKPIAWALLAMSAYIAISGFIGFFYSDVWHDAFYEYHWVFD